MEHVIKVLKDMKNKLYTLKVLQDDADNAKGILKQWLVDNPIVEGDRNRFMVYQATKHEVSLATYKNTTYIVLKDFDEEQQLCLWKLIDLLFEEDPVAYEISNRVDTIAEELSVPRDCLETLMRYNTVHGTVLKKISRALRYLEAIKPLYEAVQDGFNVEYFTERALVAKDIDSTVWSKKLKKKYTQTYREYCICLYRLQRFSSHR